MASALRPAVAAGVLVADPDGYAFRHELFREALREDLLPGERVRAHRAFAEALQAGPSLSQDPLPLVQLAVHWRGAGEHEQALRAAWTAAAGAGAAFAYAEQMLELVLELWEQVPDAAGQGGTDGAGVVEGAAEAARLAGEPERAPFGLTARELEILQLVAAGRSNQQIAAELVISRRLP